MPHHYLTCDLGAESGRLMLGTLAGNRLTLEELHRFPNGAVASGGSLHWDIPRLFAELKEGLKKAAARRRPIASISTDSWGVDYVLLDECGELMPPAFHYRDPRTAEGVRRMHALVGQAEIFAETGLQFMPLNTIYQLAAEPSERLRAARWVVTVGDAFNFFLSGVARSEVSNASTTALYNPVARDWSAKLLRALDLPARKLPPLTPPGTRLGPLRTELTAETGLGAVEVIASCTHDTGAAVVAVPARETRNPEPGTRNFPDWAYVSSGTWSLLGAELPRPLITSACREANFTNEIGYGHSLRLLKNIAGLWLVQECRRAWAEAGNDLSYARLTELAAAAAPFRSLVNPADPRFVAPGDMPAKLAAFCRETGQPEPGAPGEFIRCCLESLAFAYAVTLRQLEGVTGTKFARLHIVGGGSQNDLLNQFAADACGIEVHAGPAEATAAGNVLVQALALGHLPSLAAARDVVRGSFPVRVFVPGGAVQWAAQAERFARLRQPR